MFGSWLFVLNTIKSCLALRCKVYPTIVLIQVSELVKFWDLKPNGVLHVGAHEAEEATAYEEAGWIPIVWVEAQAKLVEKLIGRLNQRNHRVIHAAIWDVEGLVKTFNVTSNSQSSSLLEFGTHSISYPSVGVAENIEVTTTRLDTVLDKLEIPNFINLDIQGVEGRAILSLGEMMREVDSIYTEVNKWEVYRGCTLIKELDALLESRGFKRVAVRWVLGKGWGDALYLRQERSRISISRRMLFFKHQVYFYSPQIFQMVKNLIRLIFPKSWINRRVN
jgi:FkbM family methyltransferase